jgi:hypothetical protein
MKYNFSYYLTRSAEKDLKNIVEYIDKELCNRPAAIFFVKQFEEEILRLCKFPNLGIKVDNRYLKRNDIYKIIFKKYIVYYFIETEKNRIVVVRIGHSLQDQDNLLN